MNSGKSNSKNIIVTLQIYNGLPCLKAVNSLYHSLFKHQTQSPANTARTICILKLKVSKRIVEWKCEDTEAGAFSKWSKERYSNFFREYILYRWIILECMVSFQKQLISKQIARQKTLKCVHCEFAVPAEDN